VAFTAASRSDRGIAPAYHKRAQAYLRGVLLEAPVLASPVTHAAEPDALVVGHHPNGESDVSALDMPVQRRQEVQELSQALAETQADLETALTLGPRHP
jgi:hypothetical protein